MSAWDVLDGYGKPNRNESEGKHPDIDTLIVFVFLPLDYFWREVGPGGERCGCVGPTLVNLAKIA